MVDEKYFSKNRVWQGIPSITVTDKGRIYVAYYSGMTGEMVGNYVILTYSDDGINFTLYKIYKPKENKRLFDPALYKGDSGEIHLFFSECLGQVYDSIAGVFESVCYNPDEKTPKFNTAVRLCDGIMMNKPTKTSDNQLILPVSLWQRGPLYKGYTTREGSFVVNGNTNKSIGKADIGAYSCDEHMIVERIDHSLWMLIRTSYGIGESFSYDKGCTWSSGQKCHIDNPVSRFHIRRLPSGKLLLINHYNFTNRNNLYVMISEDDGLTFPYKLLIDKRDNVSYPDSDFYKEKIYIIHDRERYDKGEILLSCITEQDVILGYIGEDSYLCKVIDKVGNYE